MPTKENAPFLSQQTHSGEGNNHLEINHHYRSLSPEHIELIVKDILRDILHRKYDLAQQKISTIKKTSNIPTQINFLLETLETQISILTSPPPFVGMDCVDSLIDSTSEPFYLDVAHQTKIALLSKQADPRAANQYFETLKAPGRLATSAYYEHAASIEELNQKFSDTGLYANEAELCAFVRGGIRLGDLELCINASQILTANHPSENSSFLFTLSKFEMIAIQENIHYWMVSAKERQQLQDISEETAELLSLTKAQDKRIVLLAIRVFTFTLYESEALRKSMWENINTIGSVEPDLARHFRYIHETNPEYANDTGGKIARAKTDSGYKRKLVGSLIDTLTLSEEQLNILRALATPEQISHWVSQSGKIDISGISHDYIYMELLIFGYIDNAEDHQTLRKTCENFIDEHGDQISGINPERITAIANKLVDSNLSDIASKLTKPFIRESDIWPSDIVHAHIRALLAAHQYKSLKRLLENIEDSDRDQACWQAESLLLEHQGNLKGAVSAARKALSSSPNDIRLHSHLIYLHLRFGLADKDLKKALSAIPDSALDSYSQHSFLAIKAIAKHESFERAQRIILTWFLNDPAGSSRPITEFHILFITGQLPDAETQFYKAKGIRAFSYQKGGSTQYCFVTDLYETDNSKNIASPSEPLGEILAEGKDAFLGMSKISEIEEIPPLVAAFNLATDIRQANNRGDDPYYVFNGKNPEESIEALIETLKHADSQKPKNLVSDPKIPLFMKGKIIGNSGPTQNAYDHLLSPESHKNPLPDFGIEEPEKLIIDIYSAFYLGIMGLTSPLIESGVTCLITKETRELLEDWLEKINTPGGGKAGIRADGNIWFESSETLNQRAKSIKSEIQQLLDNSAEASPLPFDLPLEIVSIGESLDDSVFSSLRLCIANKTPWLCIDPMYAALLHNENHEIANSTKIITKLISSSQLERTRNGIYLHVQCGLPRPITIQEIIDLAKSKIPNDHYALSRLLRMYPSPFENQDELINFISAIASFVLLGAADKSHPIWRGLRSESPLNDSYLEMAIYACFRTVISRNHSQSSEHRLSMLLKLLFVRFSDIPELVKLISILATRFSKGHFLDIEHINNAINNNPEINSYE